MLNNVDITKHDLMEDVQRPLIYKDTKGNLCCDVHKGFFAAIGRWITVTLGLREYRLEHIIKTIWTSGQVAATPISERNVEYLCGKLAKSCGIQDTTFKSMLISKKLFNNSQVEGIDRSNRTDVENFFVELSKNASLQKKIGKFQSKLPTEYVISEVAGKILSRATCTFKWLELGLDINMLNNDFEGAKFLLNTRLIYNIVGFQNSTEDGPQKHQLQVDAQNRIMIKKQGSHVIVADLNKEYTFDKQRQEVVTKSNTNERWNYFSPQGLVPIDRWEYEKFERIEQLSKKEMQELLLHAQSYFKDKTPVNEVSPDSHTSVMQIFTNPRKAIKGGNNPLLTRLDASFPVHAAIRVITSDGKVYSTGFGSTVEEDQLADGKIMATVNGLPTMLDYEEFRKHEGRIVTSIPITTDACNQVLATLQQYHDETIRFNLVSQNCTTLAVDVLDIAGQKVDNKANAGQFIKGALPSLHAVPLIGVPIRKYTQFTKSIAKKLPVKLQKANKIRKQVLEFIPSKLATLFGNVLVFSLGGARGTPLPEDKETASKLLESEPRLESFAAAIKNPLDFIKSKPSSLSSSLMLIQWQLQQGSTAVHLYGKTPAMGILPPSLDNPELVKAVAVKRAHFVKKYLHNYGL